MPLLDKPIIKFGSHWEAMAYTREVGKTLEAEIQGVRWIMKPNGMSYKAFYDLLERPQRKDDVQL